MSKRRGMLGKMVQVGVIGLVGTMIGGMALIIGYQSEKQSPR